MSNPSWFFCAWLLSSVPHSCPPCHVAVIEVVGDRATSKSRAGTKERTKKKKKKKEEKDLGRILESLCFGDDEDGAMEENGFVQEDNVARKEEEEEKL